MASFRSKIIWGLNPLTGLPDQLPIPITGQPLGDGTDYLMGVEPTEAVDLNYGWHILPEYLQITIAGLSLAPGSVFTFDDSQLPLTLTYQHSDYAQPYTPVTPAPNVDGIDFMELIAATNSVATETGVTKQYLGKVVCDIDGSGVQDVNFMARIDRSYLFQKWWYQDTDDGKLYSNTFVEYTLSIWLEADVAEDDYPVGGVSPADGLSHVFPLGSSPSTGFIYQIKAASTEDGNPEFGRVHLPSVPEIVLYEYVVEPPQSEISASWTYEDAHLSLQRWGRRAAL